MAAGSRAAAWFSVDGITWTPIPHDTGSLYGGSTQGAGGVPWMFGVTLGGPGLVAVGADGTDAVVWTATAED